MSKVKRHVHLGRVLELVQLIFMSIALLGMFTIFRKYGETAGCEAFDMGYKMIFASFFLSTLVSFGMKKSEMKILLFTPVLFICAFLLLYLSYVAGYIYVYEESVGGLERSCSSAIVKLLAR